MMILDISAGAPFDSVWPEIISILVALAVSLVLIKKNEFCSFIYPASINICTMILIYKFFEFAEWVLS